MSTLLHIEVSPWAENSLSRAVSAEYVSSWNAANADGTVITRDLDKNPVPHLDVEALSAGFVAEGDRSESMAAKWGAEAANAALSAIRVTLLLDVVNQPVTNAPPDSRSSLPSSGT